MVPAEYNILEYYIVLEFFFNNLLIVYIKIIY